MVSKRTMVVVLVLAVLSVSVSFAESRISVGLWVSMDDGTYRTRLINEVVHQLNNSEEWPFEVVLNGWNTSVHVILSGMVIPTVPNGYAWGVTYTPIDYPRYTNGTVATTEASISGMNWLARLVVRFVEEQLYILRDDLVSGSL